MPENSPTFLIVGAGGVGGYYGAKLLDAGFQVRFMARGATLAALQRDGLTLRSIDGDRHFARVSAEAKAPTTAVDAIFIAVKANQTNDVLPHIATAVGPQTAIVSLQNGIDNEDLIAEKFPGAGVVGAVVFAGTHGVAPGIVEHRAEGRLTIGPWRPQDKAAVNRVLSWLERATLKVNPTDDIRRELWIKLLWNAAFNTTSCLSGAHVIDVLNAPGGLELARRAMVETRTVALAAGIDVPEAAIDRFLEDTLKLKWGTTSMLLDRQTGREVEAEAIAGAVVIRAAKYGIDTPLMSMFYTLLTAYNRSIAGKPG